MSNIRDNITFEDFGLNYDDDKRGFRKGDLGYAENILKGEDGSNFVITNLKGNRVVTYELGYSNTYFVLGSCYDALTRNVYYFIFSQPYDVTGSEDYEYDNRLLQFNEDDETITLIFRDTRNYFGLDPAKPLKDSFVLGTWLFFNPRTSEPKMIDLIMAYNYTTCYWRTEPNYYIYDSTSAYIYGDKVAYFGGLFLATTIINPDETPVTDTDKWQRIGDCYQDETDLGNNVYYDSEFRYAFNRIRHIPVYRPVCVYASDTDKNANNVRGKLFRFAYRYKYFDNTYSRYSAYSDVTLPIYDEYYNGEVPGDLDEYNCIDVIVRLHSSAIIKEVDIIFQETGGDWKRAKVINRQDITLINQVAYTYRFYNTDSAYETIDDTYFNEVHDSVPRWANSQEVINKNILCYGGCTEGFSNIDKNEIDVSLLPEIEAIDVSDSALESGRYRNCLEAGDYPIGDFEQEWDDSYFRWLAVFHLDPWYATFGMAAGDIFIITINNITVQYEIQVADVVSIDTFGAAIIAFLRDSFPLLADENAFRYSPFNHTITFVDVLSITRVIFYEPSGIAEVALTKKRGFKTGAWHPFCIYYYDGSMRRWDAQTSKDLQEGVAAWEIDGTMVYVPMFNEISPTPATTANKWNINWEINHLPPVGAKWWRWGYAGNALCSYFVQYIIECIEDEASWTRLDIAPLQTLKTTTEATWNQFPQSIIVPYEWQHGDRVRIITEASADNDMGPVVDGVYDYEILKYDATTTPGEYWIYVQQFNHGAAGIGIDSLIEIYRPARTDTATVFYEFGELMPIIEDSDGVLVHGCGSTGIQNQDSFTGDPAMGVFEAGDVYHILRTPSKPIDTIEGYFHESQWYSDFYDSTDWDKGRIGTETNFGQRTLNIVRYSDQYLQNTLINGMATFHGNNYRELNDIYGAVMRIIEIGDTLKVYQRKKPSSILIGRTEYEDAEGNITVAISERILGALRYSSTNYGTEFPESISRNNRYVYGFDIYNGVLWRDSANGIFPISGRYESADGGGDYKMETFFKQQAKNMLVSGISGCSVLTVWDERHKNLYVIFKDMITDSNNCALMFHEPSNRWICLTDMDKTYAEGWNEMLELNWWVLWGFDGGLGYSFDIGTRFAVFDIGSGLGTPETVSAFPTKGEMTIEALDPSVICDCDAVAPLGVFTMDGLLMTISITWARITAPSFSWTALQYAPTWEESESIRQQTFITCGETIDSTYYSRTAIISANTCSQSGVLWIAVTRESGELLSVNDSLSDGERIYLYPVLENTGGERSGAISILGENGDTDSITLTQEATIELPSVKLRIEEMSAAWLSFVDSAVGSIAIGSVDVLVSATFDHTGYTDGAIFTIFWISTKNGSASGNGTFPVNDSVAFLVDLPLDSAAVAGDDIYIYFSAAYSSSTAVNALLAGITLGGLNPDIICAQVAATVTAMTFLWDGTVIIGNTSDITALPTEATIYQMDSWIYVSGSVSGNIPLGGTVLNGETITVTCANNLGLLRNGYILIGNTYHNYTYLNFVPIIITQNEYPTSQTVEVLLSIYEPANGMSISGNYGEGNTGSSTVVMHVRADHAQHSAGESFGCWWVAFVNGVFGGQGVTMLEDEVTDYQTTINLWTTLAPASSVQIYIASIYIDRDTYGV